MAKRLRENTAPVAAPIADSAQAKEISSPDNQARYSPPAEVRRRQGPKGDLRRAIAGREI